MQVYNVKHEWSRGSQKRVWTNPGCHGEDERHIQLVTYPVTDVPLSLTHSDGTPDKTDKATLKKAREKRQNTVIIDANLARIKTTVNNGGNILHESILQHSNCKIRLHVRVEWSSSRTVPSRKSFPHFLMQKWRNPQYGSIITNKTV